MLDQIVRNSLALRLGDDAFADEVYTDIRDQAVRASERWHDVHVNVRLSPLPMGSGSSNATPTTAATGSDDLYLVSVRWEYSVVPNHHVRRFACVSDRDEYRDLTEEAGATSTWFMRPKAGIDVGSKEAFELLQFSIDGQERTIRRTARKDGQVYAVTVGKEVVAAQQPVTVAYTYRTIASANSQLLHIDIEQPTRGIQVELDYSDLDIPTVSVIDSIASSRQARVSRTPDGVPGRAVTVEFDGWVFPRSSVTFVWSVAAESTTSM